MVDKKIINKIITDTIHDKCYTTFKYTKSNGETINLQVMEIKKPSTFLNYLHDARQTNPPQDRWRVLEQSVEYAETKYKNAQMYHTRHGSTIAIDQDGTIISVCSNKDPNGKSYDNAGALMSFAVSKGGNKLDTFDGNYGFYRHCGFEPLSWIRFKDFDTNNIPEWITGNKNNPQQFKEEDIIFFKYTGKQTPYLTAKQFYKQNKPITGENAYEQAVTVRNNA